jgi:hypothetical protein
MTVRLTRATAACTIACLAAAARAQGTEVLTLSFQHEGQSGPTHIPIPSFDSLAGLRTLTSVNLRWDFLGAFQIQLENQLARPASTGGVGSLSITFTDPALNAFPQQFAGHIPDFEIAPADAVPGDGPDYINLGRQAWPFAFETSPAPTPTDLARYTEPGLFASIELTAFAATFSDGDALAQTLSLPRAEGNLIVTYTYIPAPGTAATLLVVLTHRARRRPRTVVPA